MSAATDRTGKQSTAMSTSVSRSRASNAATPRWYPRGIAAVLRNGCRALIAAAAILPAACGGGGSTPSGPPTPMPTGAAAKISHVVIVFQENRTPDNLFQGLPGADIANSG